MVKHRCSGLFFFSVHVMLYADHKKSGYWDIYSPRKLWQWEWLDSLQTPDKRRRVCYKTYPVVSES